MDVRRYRDIPILFSGLGLEFVVEKGVLLIQNDSETLAVGVHGNGEFYVTYNADEVAMAEETLRDCPSSISMWKDRLEAMWRDYFKGRRFMGDYIPLAVFSSKLPYRDALDVCSYIGAKMAANGRVTQGFIS